ncbi:MAG: exodeoxyribonuclease V subunit alpha [Thermodesulfobacteriota bacterium]
MYNVPFLEKTGLFTGIDIHFAGFMATLSEIDEPAVALAAALASRNVRYGDVCLDLAAYAGRDIEQNSDAQDRLHCPDLKTWQGALLKSDIIGEPGDYRPLILDHRNRLYLYRYWEYEKKLGDALLERAIQPLPIIDSAAIKNSLERLFPEEEPDETNWQKIAALVAMLKRLCVISGGPGTGKTYAVARILAFLLEQHHDKEGKLRIFLAAPTGKAASRLTESIAQARKLLPCSEVIKNAIPDTGLTIHRLLKSKGQTSRFVYNAENRLPADVVVVDEASMVDLPLMSKLVQTLSPATRLILLGDADQLASVEAGSVLGDICGKNRTNRFSNAFLNQIKSVSHITDVEDQDSLPGSTSLHDCSIRLLKSYRFDKKSGIPLFSHVVNQGRVEDVMELLEQGELTDLDWLPLKPGELLLPLLEKKLIQYYGSLAVETDPVEALGCINSFKILCAVNHGNYGVTGINQLAVQVLAKHLGKGYAGGRSIWYHGRPVLIRKNDYQLELFNGDMGVILQDGDNPENLFAYFKRNDGEIRRISPLRLPEHETAYAMTIHKSQGSEFDEVLMVLPENDTPVLTRELIYTGITRARRNLSILSPESAIRLAVARSIERTSGLRDRLTVNG